MNNIKLPQDPIFIVGFPRSGTTLLQGLLVTQPGIYSFPETHYFNVIEKSMEFDDDYNILPTCLEDVFAKIDEKISLCFPPGHLKHLHDQAAANRLTSKELFEFIVHFLLSKQGITVEDSSFHRWIEKTPNHANFLHRIKGFYPDLQVLHIVRHPVPAIFSRKLKFPFNKETPLRELALTWSRIQQNVENFKTQHPGVVLTLRYEDLVADRARELLAIAEFLHIDFSFEYLANYKHDVANLILSSETWKKNDKNHEIINTNDNYKDKCSKAEVEEIEQILIKQMTLYQYKPFFSS